MSIAPTPAASSLRDLNSSYQSIEATIRLGGGPKAIERQHEKSRLTARERIALLIDGDKSPVLNSQRPPHSESGATQFQELGLWAAFEMYKEHGGAPAAGVVTGIGVIHGRRCMIIANDATVKAGAFFPMTCKKIIRAQTIAMMARLPLIYLVDSAGVFLPMQEDVFPDTDDFGRIFRNNAVISAAGIPQIAAIMGFCVAGGGYLPVLCDTLLMTEGSGLYLAGPALVKAAIGQQVTDEELGGATMHASISGTIDFKEKDDEACIRRLRELISKYPPAWAQRQLSLLQQATRHVLSVQKIASDSHQRMSDLSERLRASTPEGRSPLIQDAMRSLTERVAEQHTERDRDSKLAASPDRLKQLLELLGGESTQTKAIGNSSIRAADALYDIFTDKPGTQYDVEQIIACLVDARGEPNTDGHTSLAPDFDEYKADYGQSIVCGYAKIGGHACGIVANQKKLVQRTMPGAWVPPLSERGHAGGSVPPGPTLANSPRPSSHPPHSESGATRVGSESRPTKAVQMPGVIYDDSADKAARFIMDCNQRKIPLIFLHDTTGFMVGRDSEQGGIIRAGAKMVNAMSNSVVPKIVVITGGSYGAGNYAMCGRAFDQFMSFAWPSAKCAVMGANQATGVLTTIEEASRKRKGEAIDEATHKAIYSAIHAGYTEQADIRHAAARGWVDRIIEPHRTREELIAALDAAAQGWDYSAQFKTGVLQT